MRKFLICMSLLIGSLAIVYGQNESGRIRIASCQFPVSADIMENLRWIEEQLTASKLRKVDIVHFPECALSGYPGADMETLDDFDWPLLAKATDSVLELAKTFKTWVILGSIHPLSEGNKPHNCLYLINPDGEIQDRYDKRFCTGGDL